MLVRPRPAQALELALPEGHRLAIALLERGGGELAEIPCEADGGRSDSDAAAVIDSSTRRRAIPS